MGSKINNHCILQICVVSLYLCLTSVDTGSTRSVPETLDTIKATKFSKLLLEHKILDSLDNTENYTIFAPCDKAFVDPSPTAKGLLSSSVNTTLLLKFHIVKHLVYLNVSSNGSLETLAGNNLLIERRAYTDNRTGKSLETFSGSTSKKKPIETPLGRVILINQIMTPPVNSVKQHLKMKEFGSFYEALSEVPIYSSVNDGENITVLVPTNEAFNNLPGGNNITRLMQSEFKEDLTNLLEHHLLPSYYYKARMVFEKHVLTKHNTYLHVQKINGTLMINNANVIESDINLKNGVIHVLDKVLELPKFRNMATYIGKNQDNFRKLSHSLQSLALVDVLNKEDGALTLLAPTDEAFEKLKESWFPLSDDKVNSLLYKDRLSYHIIGEVMYSNYLQQKQCVYSIVNYPNNKKNDPYKGIHITVYKGDLFVNNAKVIKADEPVRNGVIHWIDRVIEPPQGSAYSYLNDGERRDDFTKFVTLLEKHRKTKGNKNKKDNGLYTYLVPKDTAMHVDVTKLNTRRMRATLKQHMLNGVFYSRHLNNNQLLKTLKGEHIRVKKHGDTLHIDNVAVVKADITVDDGVIHIIGENLKPISMASTDANCTVFNLFTFILAVSISFMLQTL